MPTERPARRRDRRPCVRQCCAGARGRLLSAEPSPRAARRPGSAAKATPRCRSAKLGARRDCAPRLAQRDGSLPTPLASAEDGQAARRLEHALAQLSVRDRELLLLSAVEGFRSVEIARMLALDEALVRKRLERARARLRARMEDAP